MSLPIFTTSEDVQHVVMYLRAKATGASISEAKATLGGKLLDGRKLNGYQVWGFVEKEGDRLKLTDRGWAMARNGNGGAEHFRNALNAVAAYRMALEWAYYRNYDSLTNVDVAAYWHEHHSDSVGTTNENTIKDNAVCFFHLCQAAGFGTLTLGRRGNPTRLTINREAISEQFDAMTTNGESMKSPHESVPSLSEGEQPADVDPPQDEHSLGGNGEVAFGNQLGRVFISHGGNVDVVGQIETMLALAELQSEVAVKEESTAIPIPEKVFDAMRKCQAGIIAVTVEEGRRDEAGNYVVNENVLIEIGAAFVLYDKKVVLLWDKRLPVPSNLQGLYRCEFEGDELSWSAGMRLMKAIQDFKN